MAETVAATAAETAAWAAAPAASKEGIRMIRMQGIRKEYHMGDSVLAALDGVDIHIKPHEFVSIIGPSGSGKSTLMNIIGCLDTADEGTYYLDGQEIDDYSEDELADIRGRKIGFIFQQFNLLPKLTAQENVELPLIYQGMSASKRHARSEEVLERVGLLDRMDHKPTELSGGQQQRVAIARALASRPSLLLADEPTGNLDFRTSAEVMKILLSINAAGVTVVMTTHNQYIVDSYRQRVVELDAGRVVRDERAGRYTLDDDF